MRSLTNDISTALGQMRVFRVYLNAGIKCPWTSEAEVP